jgi:adenylyltransferase/sulfurtransferase
MPRIHIPTPLRQYAEKRSAVEVGGATVGDALSKLTIQFPDLRRHLYTEDGKLRAFVNVYLNDEDVRYLQKEATAVKDNDSISIVPSIAGGTDTGFPQHSRIVAMHAFTKKAGCRLFCCRR